MLVAASSVSWKVPAVLSCSEGKNKVENHCRPRRCRGGLEHMASQNERNGRRVDIFVGSSGKKVLGGVSPECQRSRHRVVFEGL